MASFKLGLGFKQTDFLEGGVSICPSLYRVAVGRRAGWLFTK
jgi:hypothetical protein